MNLALVQTAPPDWRPLPPAAEQPGRSPSGLSLLLERLHQDPEEAGREYERLRARLVKFFDWRGASHPDECADETLDRLAHKLEETDVVDVQKYMYGIARLVLLEQMRRPTWTSIDDSPSVLAAPASETPETPLHDSFDACLAELPAESRSLLLQYYDGDGRTKIDNRRRLAAALGVTDNALRSRVQRLRDQLERAVLTHVAASPRAFR